MRYDDGDDDNDLMASIVICCVYSVNKLQIMLHNRNAHG